MVTLIGLNGIAKSGKDTTAEYLAKTSGYVNFSFAKHLKDIAALAFGLERSRLDDQEYKAMFIPRYNKTVREILQILGTECFRDNFSDNFWINHIEYQIDKCLDVSPNSLITISDVRFDNEARMIKSRGGVIINIDRGIKTAIPDHISESGLKPNLIDFTIDNNGSLADLYYNIEDALNKCQT